MLLRVASCGVCASELDMWEGRAAIEYPRFPGHEISGTVERAAALAATRTADVRRESLAGIDADAWMSRSWRAAA